MNYSANKQIITELHHSLLCYIYMYIFYNPIYITTAMAYNNIAYVTLLYFSTFTRVVQYYCKWSLY